jgi:gliding motility-associated-like protein
LILFILLGVQGVVHATHLIGGYMNYEFLAETRNGKYQYKIMLHMFRDVEQSDVQFDDEIELGVYFNNTNRDIHRRFIIPLIYRLEVKPPGSEECDYYADKRIEMGYYEGVITLDAYANGYHLNFVRCCRNIQDNLTLDNGSPFQGQTYTAFIPDPALRNSSPYFQGVPSPYMCALDTNTFLNRAIDKDGDSLVYRFVRPFQGGRPTQGGANPTPPDNLNLPIQEVEYRPGYSANRPFGNGDFIDIDQSNGLTTLYAPQAGSYVVAIEVIEYRNGVELSRVRLDMQILVLRCPPNNKPDVRSPQGDYFEIEAGEQLCFFVQGSDPDSDQNVTLSMTGDILDGTNNFQPPLATFDEVTGRGNVTGEFCWTPDCGQAREKPYVVAANVLDDGCPAKFDYLNIRIKVNEFIGSDEIIGPENACAGSPDILEYNAANPKANTTFYWEVENGSIIGDNTSSSIDVQWTGDAGIGILRMVEISEYGCPGDTVEKEIALLDAPDPPAITGEDTVCEGVTGVSYTIANNPSSTYTWFMEGGIIESTNITGVTVGWPVRGDHRIGVVETSVNGCESDTAWINVNVRRPLPSVDGPTSVCPNSEDIEYFSNGENGSSFIWTISGGTQVRGGSSDEIGVDWGEEGAGEVSVVETDRFGCTSFPVLLNIDITYDLAGIEPIGPDEVCEFDVNVPYYVFESNGSIYRWNITGGIQASGDSTSDISVDWGATGNGRVTVQQWAFDAVNNRECISPEVSLDVTIHPLPTADEITGDMDICQTEEESFYTLTGFAGSTYQWEVDGATTGFSGQGTNTIGVVWDQAGTYTIRVLETSINGCPGEWVDTTIIVRPLPEAEIIEGTFVLCHPNQQNQRYYINGLANSTYTWEVEGATSFSQIGDTLIVDWNNQGYGIIRGLETTEYGCIKDTLDLEIYVNRLTLDMHVVSVGFPDDYIQGHWAYPTDSLVGEGPFVEKRIAGSEGVWTAVANPAFDHMIDPGLNTDENIYEYRVRATDLCGNEILSEIHTHVNLRGTQNDDDFSVFLEFTEYLGWDNGVDFYEIYRKVNNETNFELVGSVAGNAGDLSFAVPGAEEVFRQCFRIKAYELSGEEEISWSNEICFFFTPNVYVPTAFTPNKDNLNDGFIPVAVAVDSFAFQIFNRWGEQVFYTEDKEESWLGDYQGQPAPAGVYGYLLYFTDYNGREFVKTGTIHLIR